MGKIFSLTSRVLSILIPIGLIFYLYFKNIHPTIKILVNNLGIFGWLSIICMVITLFGLIFSIMKEAKELYREWRTNEDKAK